MWKTIALCASLFGSAALGVMAMARWIEPGALPAAVAIGLCVIGVVLILVAPSSETAVAAAAALVDEDDAITREPPPLRAAPARTPRTPISLAAFEDTRTTDKLRTI